MVNISAPLKVYKVAKETKELTYEQVKQYNWWVNNKGTTFKNAN